MSRLTQSLISKGAANATVYEQRERLNPGRVSGTVSGLSGLRSSAGALTPPRLASSQISAGRPAEVPMIDQNPIQDALNRGGDAFMQAFYRGAMDLADRRSGLESQQAMNDLRTEYRNKYYGDGGIATLKGQAGADVYKRFSGDFVDTRDQIASGMSPSARRKFLVSSESYVNGQLDNLAALEAKNLEEWQADVLIAGEIADGEDNYQNRFNLQGVADTIKSGRVKYIDKGPKAMIDYQDRMWTSWANSLLTEPGQEADKVDLITAAMQIDPAQGGMSMPTQNKVTAALQPKLEAAIAIKAYNASLADAGGDPIKQWALLSKPDAVDKYGGVEAVSKASQVVETQIMNGVQQMELAEKMNKRASDKTFYGLLAAGDLNGAMTYANGLSDKKLATEYMEKAKSGRNETDDVKRAEVTDMIRAEKYDEAEKVISSYRLNGLSNETADMLLKRVDDARKPDGSKGKMRNHAIDYAKTILPDSQLAEFEADLDQWIEREGKDPDSMEVFEEAKNRLQIIKVSDPWGFNTWRGRDRREYVPMTELEQHEELEKISQMPAKDQREAQAKTMTAWEREKLTGSAMMPEEEPEAEERSGNVNLGNQSWMP